MTKRNHSRQIVICSLVAMMLGNACIAADDEHAHHHHASVPDMDGEGRRLDSYDVRHEMTAEDMTGLREKIALYRGLTDRELEMNMNAMGPDYAWYVSDLGLKGDVGVLILSHGVGENSDRLLKEAFQPIGAKHPTAIGFGMAMMSSAHLQAAVDDLVARGARKIVLVDEGTTTEYNTLTRQWRYIFGIRDESTYLEVPRVQANGVEFIWTGHFGDNPLITEILYEHAKEVSKNPANEVVILVGHGPEDLEDNEPDLAILQAHVDRIAAKGEFADVKIINLQDDAIPPIRESNVRKLRRWIKQSTDTGQHVIVVAVAAASFGVQQHIRQDLRGLEYTFAEKGLSEHPNFVKWVDSVVDEAARAEAVAASNDQPPVN